MTTCPKVATLSCLSSPKYTNCACFYDLNNDADDGVTDSMTRSNRSVRGHRAGPATAGAAVAEPAPASNAATRGSKRRRSSAAATEVGPAVTPAAVAAAAAPSGPLRRDDHGEALTTVLSAAGQTGRFADVKLVCGGTDGDLRDPDSVLWSHAFLLASASPFLGSLLREASSDGAVDHAVHLPDVRAIHLRMVLDYLYTGAMYLTAADLAPVLGVIETLRMTCGVSVSKMVRKQEPAGGNATSSRTATRAARSRVASSVKKQQQQKVAAEEPRWVEEAKFACGLQEIKRELTEGEDESEAMRSPTPPPPPPPPPPTRALPDTPAEPEKSKFDGQPVPYGDSGAFEVVAGSSDDEEDEEDSVDATVMVDPEDMGAATDGEEQQQRQRPTTATDRKQQHTCVMCGKQFQHEDNLRVHLQNHLGVKAQLSSCTACNRIFRSSLELDLHETSHRFSKFQRRRVSRDKPTAAELFRRSSARRAVRFFVARWARQRREERRRRAEEERRAKALEAKMMARLGKKKLRVNLKKVKLDDGLTPSSALKLKVKFPLLQQKKKHELLARRASLVSDNYCGTCERAFSTAGSLRRHVNNFHSGVVVVPRRRPGSEVESTTEDDEAFEQQQPKKRGRGRPPLAKNLAPQKKKRRTIDDASSVSSCSSPARPSAVGPGRPRADAELTCPTCDKTFPARSIYERHLKTSRHGAAAEAGGDAFSAPPGSTPPYLTSPTKHFNQVLQPTMEVGGVTVNKYECHLCNKVFVRVKDLAKHREKACSAWM